MAATYEQASSRGIEQESTNGLLTFKFSIRNHLTTSFSTIRAAVAEKAGLFKTQKEFFKYALAEGRKSETKGYVFGDNKDVNLTQKFLSLLLQHRIKVFQLCDNITQDGKTFQKDKSYFVPSGQPNYLIVHSLFEENLLTDSIYYDNTGWSVIHAYGLKYARLATLPAKGNVVTAVNNTSGTIEGGRSNLAYLLSYTDYNASRALYHLLVKGVLVKTAFKPFTANNKAYEPGALVIPVNGQSFTPDSLYKALQEVAADAHLNFAAVSTGYSTAGIDLGSNNIKTVRKPEVVLAFGQGVTSSEAGQVWFLLNQQLNLPVTKIDLASFQRASLARYNVLILPGGIYTAWDKATVDKIKAWVADGGTLITFQTASAWAIQQDIIQEKLVPAAFSGRGGGAEIIPAPATNTAISANNTATPGTRAERRGAATARPDSSATSGGARTGSRRTGNGARLDYARQEEVEGSKRINGAIFQADLDITNPIAYGISSRKLFINKNGSTILQPSSNKYATVAQYTGKPFINGYAPRESITSVANSAAIISTNSGRGSVVLFADDPTYRVTG